MSGQFSFPLFFFQPFLTEARRVPCDCIAIETGGIDGLQVEHKMYLVWFNLDVAFERRMIP